MSSHLAILDAPIGQEYCYWESFIAYAVGCSTAAGSEWIPAQSLKITLRRAPGIDLR